MDDARCFLLSWGNRYRTRVFPVAAGRIGQWPAPADAVRRCPSTHRPGIRPAGSPDQQPVADGALGRQKRTQPWGGRDGKWRHQWPECRRDAWAVWPDMNVSLLFFVRRDDQAAKAEPSVAASARRQSVMVCSLDESTATGMPKRLRRPPVRPGWTPESHAAERLCLAFAAHRRRDIQRDAAQAGGRGSAKLRQKRSAAWRISACRVRKWPRRRPRSPDRPARSPPQRLRLALPRCQPVRR